MHKICKYLHVERPGLDLRRTFADDEWDAVLAVLGGLHEVHTEEVKLPLELLMATLDGQALQALLMAG